MRGSRTTAARARFEAAAQSEARDPPHSVGEPDLEAQVDALASQKKTHRRGAASRRCAS